MSKFVSVAWKQGIAEERAEVSGRTVEEEYAFINGLDILGISVCGVPVFDSEEHWKLFYGDETQYPEGLPRIGFHTVLRDGQEVRTHGWF